MSNSNIVVVVVAAVLAAAWIPVGIHFWRSWRRRGSPLSLAIFGLVGFPIFINASAAIFLSQQKSTTVFILVVTNLILLLNFLVCFKWQKERFPNARSQIFRSAEEPDYWKRTSQGIEQEIGDEDTTPPRH